MQHRFYNKSKKEQFKIQVAIALAALIVVLMSLLISWLINFYLITILFIPVVLSVIAPFFDVPAMKKRGKLRYHSPLFVSQLKQNEIIIHGGTLFDYVFAIDRKLNGPQRTRYIIQQYLQGLLHLIELCEKENRTNLKVRGTSYIINERTAQRMGFKVVQTDGLQQLILIFNYVNIFIANSIAKGKPAFPKLNHTRSFEANVADLIRHKEQIGILAQRFQNSALDVEVEASE